MELSFYVQIYLKQLVPHSYLFYLQNCVLNVVGYFKLFLMNFPIVLLQYKRVELAKNDQEPLAKSYFSWFCYDGWNSR